MQSFPNPVLPSPCERTIRIALGAALAFSAVVFSQSYKYDFGAGKVEAGYTQVLPGSKYSAAAGFGFESGSMVTCIDRGGADALRSDFCTSADTIVLFSVKVPQGNYNVTVHFGDPSGTSETSVQAESHRYLFDRVATSNGQLLSRTITVNRREVKSMDGSVTMSIKDREREYFTWDDKLTFIFYGRKKAIAGIELVPVTNAITVFLCGNSTVVDQMGADAGWCSWGQVIGRFFKPGVAIANYAESGLTSGGFLSMKRLAKIMADAKPGDYVFVEFGHNDQKNSSDVAKYPANLKSFRDQIVAKKAIPIFVIPTARDGDTDPKSSIGGLAETMRSTAKTLGVTTIDLNAMTIQVMKALGADRKYAYMDVSHFKNYGAYELGRCVAKAIKELDNSLTPFLLNDLPVFDPTKPDPVNVLTTPGIPSGISPRSPDASGYFLSIRGARIEYSIPTDAMTEMVVYSLGGKVLQSLALPQGREITSWNGIAELQSGVYLVALKSRGATLAQLVYSKI